MIAGDGLTDCPYLYALRFHGPTLLVLLIQRIVWLPVLEIFGYVSFFGYTMECRASASRVGCEGTGVCMAVFWILVSVCRWLEYEYCGR